MNASGEGIGTVRAINFRPSFRFRGFEFRFHGGAL
ncbi:hypothetical protein SDJN02_04151, partial [Cucurbita argyrosperma subsp. argyrosperma]